MLLCPSISVQSRMLVGFITIATLLLMRAICNHFQIQPYQTSSSLNQALINTTNSNTVEINWLQQV